MALKTQVPLVMMVVVLCASAGASVTVPDDTSVADEVGPYAYPPVPSPTALDDSLVADEVSQYASTPAPSPAVLDDGSLVADIDEVAQYASAPAPSGAIGEAFLLGDDVGLYAPAPAPVSGVVYGNLLADEAALVDDTLGDAGEVTLSAAAPSPSTGLEDTQPQQDYEVTPAGAPLQSLSLLAELPDKDDGVAEKESIQKIIDTEGCIYEIITFANYRMREEEKVGPACCKAVEDIVNNKNWPDIFPFNPAFPQKIKAYCAQYGGSPASAPTSSYAPALPPAGGPAYAPASAPTTSYAPELAPAEGPAYAPDQDDDWLY